MSLPNDLAARPDRRMELLVSRVLRTGVILASAAVALGGVAHLIRHADVPVSYRVFHAASAGERSIGGIVADVSAHPGRASIMLGVMLLILTPFARVALSLIGFARARDRTYTLVTAVVLTTLLFGLLTGLAKGG